MGTRSTIITDHWAFTFSSDFVDKYKEAYNFGGKENNSLPLSSRYEKKRFWDDLEEDIVEELKLQNEDHRIHAVWLNEDGLISRIVFTKDGVVDYEYWAE